MDPRTQEDRHGLSVRLGAHSYEVMIENGLIARAGELIKNIKPSGKAFIVTDENVKALHAKALLQSLQAVQIPAKLLPVAAGEASKDFSTLERLVIDLVSVGIERDDLVIAFGGGMVGDLAGFAASIVLRGVDVVQIPTTLLAQVDSSIGGKTGINLSSGKNLIGSFHQPRLVVIDPDLLDTLDPRQLRAGYAEIVKIALAKDADFFAWLEKHRAAVLKNTPERRQAIYKACCLKAEIVMRDEREHGERKLLNFGHTFGHAFEALNGYSDALLHGEAVSIGLALAHRFSAQLGLCALDESKRAIAHLQDAGLPVTAGAIAENLLDIMLKDKKMTGGRITLILTRGVGRAFVSHNVDAAQLNAFLQSEVA